MIKTKLKQKEQRREHRIEFAEEQSARVVMLLQEEGGFLEGDKEQEFNGKIKRVVDNKESASKCSDLDLAQLVPPYTIYYTRNGRHLLLSGVETRRAVAPHGEHVRCGPE